jgi:transcriptional regulator GlxA family with amidase domain
MRVENLILVREYLRRRFSGELVIRPTGVVVSSAEEAFLQRVKEAVERNLAEPDFGVDRLAEEVGLSARQLHRRIRELTRLSVAGYIRTMRLQRAAELLEQEAGTVSEIASHVGYRSVNSFSRLFRSVYGVPPSEYTRQV